jgi:hypothetical protein
MMIKVAAEKNPEVKPDLNSVSRARNSKAAAKTEVVTFQLQPSSQTQRNSTRSVHSQKLYHIESHILVRQEDMENYPFDTPYPTPQERRVKPSHIRYNTAAHLSTQNPETQKGFFRYIHNISSCNSGGRVWKGGKRQISVLCTP